MVPRHELCLFKLGIHLGELWQLTPLARWLRVNMRSRFMLTAPPLRLPGAVTRRFENAIGNKSSEREGKNRSRFLPSRSNACPGFDMGSPRSIHISITPLPKLRMEFFRFSFMLPVIIGRMARANWERAQQARNEMQPIYYKW